MLHVVLVVAAALSRAPALGFSGKAGSGLCSWYWYWYWYGTGTSTGMVLLLALVLVLLLVLVWYYYWYYYYYYSFFALPTCLHATTASPTVGAS